MSLLMVRQTVTQVILFKPGLRVLTAGVDANEAVWQGLARAEVTAQSTEVLQLGSIMA